MKLSVRGVAFHLVLFLVYWAVTYFSMTLLFTQGENWLGDCPGGLLHNFKHAMGFVMMLPIVACGGYFYLYSLRLMKAISNLFPDLPLSERQEVWKE